MSLGKMLKKWKSARRKRRLEKEGFWGNFWMKYYRFWDRRRGKRQYNWKCLMCPIDPNLIVLESFKGKFYSCNPKALFEELLKDPAYAGYRFVWSFADCKRRRYLTRNKRVRLVKKGSPEYYEAMATARYKITNSTTPYSLSVRKGQTCIQTWHGTPLKRLGMDIEREGNAAQSLKEIHDLYKREGKLADYLLSPTPYTTEKLVSAFGLSEEERKKKIVELGYPRNVALFTYTDETVAELREFYGIPEGKKVILYAPTFRDGEYQYGKGFIYQIVLDVERLQKRFGDSAVVLMRTHYLANAQFDYERYEGFLFKVSGVEDINRLYIISDLLVTDYSSVMFDFSILRRPMIFYMYDEEQYRGELRDFYIEPDILPGPIVATQDELEDEIEKALFTPFVCDEKYEAFCQKFVFKDDADAAKRVIAATIAPLAKPLPVPWRLRMYRKHRKRLARTRATKKKLTGGIFLPMKKYADYLKKPLRENRILLEAQQGKEMAGNMFVLLEELVKNPAYADYELYLTAARGKKREFKKRLAGLGMKRVHVVERMGYAYFKVLATTKYLLNDNTFTGSFVKREGQVYLNTWHGTPLKTLGKKIKQEAHAIGNAQKNFLQADYMLQPNEFTMEHMIEDYMLANIGRTETWLMGYPRNSIFFHKEAGDAVRKKYGLEGKKVFAFLPTWRGVVGSVSSGAQVRRLLSYLAEVDEGLPDDYVIYFKLHVVSNREVSMEEFRHIRLFPTDCETYEFLNATDGLITDYSSVMFDYALTRKKIMLFTYDEEDYEEARGFYFPLSELPFPQAKRPKELLSLILQPKEYDDTEFLKKFCPYDREDAAGQICKKLLLGEPGEIKTVPMPDNHKKNVVIYGGAMEANGITTSLFNLLKHLDYDKYNYILLYRMDDLKRRPAQLERLPEEMASLGVPTARTVNFFDTVVLRLWVRKKLSSFRFVEPRQERLAKWETRRMLAGCRVDKLVHFSGYSNDLVPIFKGLDCDRTIFVHNDMEKEVKEKNRIRMETLSRAYQEYDSVAVVTEDIRHIAERIAGYIPARTEKKPVIRVVKNIIDYERVLELKEQELMLDATTQINIPPERLREILDGDAVKFINIGRFSPEKGHMRLLNAFDKVHAKHPDTYLFIIGGGGVLYEETLAKAQNLASYDHIVIIHYMSNPYALLKKCDYFVFSSLYEGFGLVLVEADLCGVRSISTDIDGPRLFLQKYGGHLVEDSDEGIYNGMLSCLNGEIKNLLTVDYAEYNREAVEQFEGLLP